MINTKYVREHEREIRESLEKRRSKFNLDRIVDLDKKWRDALAETQKLQAERNKASLQVSELKKQHKDKEAEKMISELGRIKEKIEENSQNVEAFEDEINKLIWNLPNTLDKSVPIGNPPDDNKILKTWGDAKKKRMKSHEEILEKMGLLDMERAAKVAGSRFYYLKGDLVLLEQALGRYALDFLSQRGYIPILPPFMLRKKYYRGVAPLATFEDALYRITESKEASELKDIEHMDDELYMIGTAEHPLAAMHAEELLVTKNLPLKYAGISPCFRREAGAHGKDQKGIFRVHQFDKVEQFVYCKQEDEKKYFDELLKNSEDIWQSLEIPYRLVLLCSGDTGHQMAKTIDIEAWFPGQNEYRELGSCSSASDWQSVRLDIKYDDNGERKYAYTLNNTAISLQRTLACIVENYANEDGSITVPKALVPYMNKKVIG